MPSVSRHYPSSTFHLPLSKIQNLPHMRDPANAGQIRNPKSALDQSDAHLPHPPPDVVDPRGPDRFSSLLSSG